MMRLTCTYHCDGCDSHFTSLQAFDDHRSGSHQAGTRHCIDPDSVKRIELYGEGRCAIGPNCLAPKNDVLVYGTRGGREKARKAFSQPGGKRQAA